MRPDLEGRPARVRALWRLYGQGASQLWRGAARGESRLAPDAVLAMSGEPHIAFNFGVVDAGPDAERSLRDFVACLRERGLPGTVVLTDATADELAPAAHDLGLARAGACPLLARGVADPPHAPAAGFEVARVADQDAAADLTAVVSRAWSVPLALAARALGGAPADAPGVDVFLARLEGAPVSVAVTTLTGASVGVWAVSTVPEQRRRGAAGAVMAALLRHHRAAAEVYLSASSASQGLYERFGFETVAEGVVWRVEP